MSFDAIKTFLTYKNDYIAKRGGTPGTTIVLPGKLVPKTTWRDVYAFSAVFLNKCEYVKPATGSTFWQWATKITTASGEQIGELVEKYGTEAVARFNAAKAKWEATFPYAKLSAEYGAYDGHIKLLQAIKINGEYPYNEEFWGYGHEFAVARSVFGSVPGQMDLWLESVKEAAKELPDRLVGSVPDFPWPENPFGDLLKWTLYGGGALLLLWLISKQKEKKK
jgi:hypothetical protein